MIPVIHALIQRNSEVIIAADGRCLQVLQKEFPKLRFIRLKGYDIRYSPNSNLAGSILVQIPHILWSIYYEHRWLRKLLRRESFDAVISDNRFGLFHGKTKCIYITHQVNIRMPRRFKRLEKIVNRINHYFISKYDQCWIPDYRLEPSLAGELSHGHSVFRKIHYIGPLSRFKRDNDSAEGKWDILFLLSGPEPQRTLFEEMALKAAKGFPATILIVRGIPEGHSEISPLQDHCFITDYLTSDLLQQALTDSSLVICRSGYSTIMDLAATGKKAVLVPTPGQTEQEYLAGILNERKIFYCESQQDFQLDRAIKRSAQYTGWKYDFSELNLRETIESLGMSNESIVVNSE